MSYTTELTDDCMGIIHHGNGIVTGQELLEACRSTTQLLENTENFHFEFIDFSEVDQLQITGSDLDQIVAQDDYAAIFRPDAVVVIVAPRDDLFAIGEKWQERICHLRWKTQISRSRPEALAWLRANYPTLPKRSSAQPSAEDVSSTESGSVR